MVYEWLLVSVIAYLFFSLSYLGDKLILSGPPKPNSYTFYVGVISLFVVVLIPFVKFGLPNQRIFFWIKINHKYFALNYKKSGRKIYNKRRKKVKWRN